MNRMNILVTTKIDISVLNDAVYIKHKMMLMYWFRSAVVITSALHAECRELEPRRNLEYFLLPDAAC